MQNVSLLSILLLSQFYLQVKVAKHWNGFLSHCTKWPKHLPVMPNWCPILAWSQLHTHLNWSARWKWIHSNIWWWKMHTSWARWGESRGGFKEIIENLEGRTWGGGDSRGSRRKAYLGSIPPLHGSCFTWGSQEAGEGWDGNWSLTWIHTLWEAVLLQLMCICKGHP